MRPAWTSETEKKDRDKTMEREEYFDVQKEHKDFVEDIKDEIGYKMVQIEEGTDEQKKNLHWAVGKNVPTVMMLAADDLVSCFDHRRRQDSSGVLPATPQFLDAAGRYYEFFPMNSCTFQFPRDTTGTPSH